MSLNGFPIGTEATLLDTGTRCVVLNRTKDRVMVRTELGTVRFVSGTLLDVSKPEGIIMSGLIKPPKKLPGVKVMAEVFNMTCPDYGREF